MVLFAHRPLSESILDTLASVAGTIAQGIERKRAEQAVREREREARLIVDSIPGPVALLNKNGDLQFVNRQIVEYTGRALDELKQCGTNDTVHPDDLPHVIEVFTRSIASGDPYEIVQRLRRSDGAYHWFQHKRTFDRLRAYPWPGNVRELQNVIERSVIVCDTDEFTVDESWLSAGPTVESRLALPGSLAAHEKAIIEDALQASGGRVFEPSGAAARLGIPRSTLESKIRALRINKNRFRARPARR